MNQLASATFPEAKLQMTSDTATMIATWWATGKTLPKKAAVYYLIIHEGQIAASITRTLDINKSTTSRWIKKLIDEQYIVQSNNFIEHQKEMEQVRKGSVSLRFKAYKPGPRSVEMENNITKLRANMGVHREQAIWTPLPGGVMPVIDIHRLDWNLPIDKNGARGGKAHQFDIQQLERMGVRPSGRVVRGWQSFTAPEIETEVGTWKVHFKRKVKETEQGLEYGDWCDGHPVRLTMPGRMPVTAEEAMDEDSIKQRVAKVLWDLMGQLSKEYGWTFGFPKQKNSQEMEFGVSRYDPELAKEVIRRRKSGEPRMLPMADGITADGSHDLLKDNIVHLDAKTGKQAAMQANPVMTLDSLMKVVEGVGENVGQLASEQIEIIEENAVNTTTRIADNMQTELLNLIERMNNTYEQMIVREEERRLREEERRNALWNETFEADRAAFAERMGRAITRFEQSLRGRGISLEDGQMILTDFEQP